MSDVIPINERARQRLAAREARRTANKKNGNALPILKTKFSATRIALMTTAFALAATGLAINAHFARSLGSTEFAGWLFLAIGVASDVAAFVLPTWALSLPRWRSMLAWALWSVTFAFALIASVGFASLNITDVAIARASQTTPAIEDARRALEDAKLARDRECIRIRRPMCQHREDEVITAQRRLDAEHAKIVADPQAEGTVRLVAWLTRGHLGVDPAMVRLVLLTVLPQLGGLLLMVARR
jgi:hypothetical protein